MDKEMNNNDWLNFLHQIHNKIRNSAGLKLTGMGALNEINNLLMLWFVEKYIDIEKLDDECKFSVLYNKYATDEKINDDKKTYGKISNATKLWKKIYKIDYNAENYCVLQRIAMNPYLSAYIYDDVMKISVYSSNGSVSNTVQDIMNYMYKRLNGVVMDRVFYDAFGSAYEKFKTDHVGNTGKHTGQHFTPVTIKKFIVNEIKPQYNETYYEPCAGSGGFIHTVYNYVCIHDEKHSKKFRNNIYANECNPEIIKPLKINMLLHDIHRDEIQEMDSLSGQNCNSYFEKFDIICTNPPFGMSSTLCPLEFRDGYWDSIMSGKNVIKDSSGQFIIHIYNSLKGNGRAGFVIDRGVLNNGNNEKSWQTKIRKFLIENTNLYKIILLPTGIFTYTNFATAIVFFKKGEKTKEVKIYEGKFKDVKEKTGLVIDEENPIKIFTHKELKNNGYTLKINNVKTEELKIDCARLGDVCVLERGKVITKEEMKDGDIPVISAGMGIFGYHNKSNRDKNAITVSCSGYAGYVSKHSTKIWAGDCFTITPKDDKILNDYVYYYLKLRQNDIYKLRHGQGVKHIGPKDMEQFIIPVLSFDQQEKIINLLDGLFETQNIDKLCDIVKDVPIFNLLISKQYDEFDSLIQLIYKKIETDININQIEENKKQIFRSLKMGLKCETYKLGEIVDIKIGGTPSRKKPEYWENGTIFWCKCGELNKGIVNDTDEKITELGVKESNVKLIKKGSVMMTVNLGIGITGIAGSDMYCSQNIIFFRHTEELMNEYLRMYLSCMNVKQYATGTISDGCLNMTSVRGLPIEIPSDEQMKHIIQCVLGMNPYKSIFTVLSHELDNAINNVLKYVNEHTN